MPLRLCWVLHPPPFPQRLLDFSAGRSAAPLGRPSLNSVLIVGHSDGYFHSQLFRRFSTALSLQGLGLALGEEVVAGLFFTTSTPPALLPTSKIPPRLVIDSLLLWI